MTEDQDQRLRRTMALAGIGQAIALAAALVPQHVLAQALTPVATMAPAAARTSTEYMGGGFLTLSEECGQYGWTGVHQIMIRMQPQGRPGNSRTESQMALFFGTGTISFRYDYREREMDGGIPIDEATYVWNGPYSPTFPTMSMSFYGRYGGSIDSDEADLLSVHLALNNFNEHPNCTATMRVSMGRN